MRDGIEATVPDVMYVKDPPRNNAESLLPNGGVFISVGGVKQTERADVAYVNGSHLFGPAGGLNFAHVFEWQNGEWITTTIEATNVTITTVSLGG